MAHEPQTRHTKGQSQRACTVVLGSYLQTSHIELSTTFLLNKFALVGRAFRQTLQRKFLFALGGARCHILVHGSFYFEQYEDWPNFLSSISVFRWYALLTLKTPDWLHLQMSLFGLLLGLIGIDLIRITSSLEKIASTRERFHYVVSLLIRIETLVFAWRN